jgi:hypothetical protein
VARLLIVGGGRRGRLLAKGLVGEGHGARIVTRTEAGRAAIEAVGAECWIGTPDRLETLRGALESVTIACWLLGTARGSPAELRALHGHRLRFFLSQTIDTTVRGLVYETGGAGGRTGASGAGEEDCAEEGYPGAEVLGEGAEIVREMCARNEIPAAIVAADPREERAWLEQARGAVEGLLSGSRGPLS